MSITSQENSGVITLTFEGDELQELKDELAEGIGAEVAAALDAGSNHPYGCNCPTCLRWWAYMGPEWEDEDTPAGYGPFTKEQVNAEQRRLGIEVTP